MGSRSMIDARGLYDEPMASRAESFHGEPVEAEDLVLADLPDEWLELGQAALVGYVEDGEDAVATHAWRTPAGTVYAADGWILIRDPSLLVTDRGLEHDTD